MKGNAISWLVWIGGIAAVTMVARNPLYTATILLVSILMLEVYGRIGERIGVSFSRLAVVILLISALYNALFVHTGEYVLFNLPPWPLVGGQITLESLMAGLANGFVLVTLISIFITLNAVVPGSELIRLVPAAFTDMGYVLLIAITYVPETKRHLQRIREAQAIRGHDLDGLREWRPIVIPLLVGGLERAMRLAEALTARGYGSGTNYTETDPKRGVMTLAVALALLGTIIASWLGYVGFLILGAGVVLMLVIVRQRGQGARHTKYFPTYWRLEDIVRVVTAILAVVAVLIPWSFVERSSLYYSPHPVLQSPEYSLFFGLPLALLALPVFFKQRPSIPWIQVQMSDKAHLQG